MLSALVMFHRMRRAFTLAVREQEFLPVFGAAVILIVSGTVAYSAGEGWSVIDGLYFAVATLTTSSIADPELVLTHPWLKLFTVFFVLTGIGILVELVRRLGLGFVAALHEDRLKVEARLLERKGEGGQPPGPARSSR